MKKKIFLIAAMMLGMMVSSVQAKDLVAYFSAEGHTKAVAERIAELTGADIYRIEAANPYAANPYDDSDRIKEEAYKDLRPAVANPPSQEWIDRYDRIFIGSPCWWHQPAMVVCTFLETYDLSKKVIVPFFTYGATIYLNESMQKIYKCTPNSVHVPETLPEDLDADDITTPGRPDDAGIEMPGNASGVERWLERLGLNGDTAVSELGNSDSDNVRISHSAGEIIIDLTANMLPNTTEIYNLSGSLIDRMYRMSGKTHYSLSLPSRSIYLLSMTYGKENRRLNRKIAL